MEFNANTTKLIQQAINPTHLSSWFWLERKIIRAAIDNVNYVSTPYDYPYEGAGNNIITWANSLGFETTVIDDRIMISW